MSDQVVLKALEHGVLTLTLNRPDKLNAANDALLLGLTGALREAADDSAVRVVVITGAGRGFCAGQDLGEVGAREMGFAEHLRHTYNPLISTMRALEKPVITAVNGVAAGAGASLALAGDIRLWSSAVTFIEVFSNIALVPDSGSTWMLPRLVGYHKAFELMALAERVNAEEGLRLGLCERVFPAETFAEDVRAYAEQLAARPVRALGLTKRALNQALSSTLDEALENEAQAQQRAGEDPEHREGLAAFKEKRSARFKDV
ncbi:enoyl-CoA hydratase-related protein [Deinococcus peraridilitoris]|uniref:Enoyl-CoA hydratase/carnithine racemase n=1 Tax=Deinococcus peraridilitoris (strain DSM 19664 / LMG 22246 / CIP 109416 / KR-200) TaxID=937777 RepID=L0A0S2_DEIPD|nr:enoyl-CoA hydratase-related protein [Deinococcus peraridilitoris]AFZ67493.1 enoyl-CoA hydratase/carnithine racemase [Deinococcus peraridilitoris DSM 19664]